MQNETTANHSNPLGTEKISKLLPKFAIPSIIALLVSSLYNIVDQVFIGHGVGIYGNAATNVAYPLTIICTASALLFGIGGAANFGLELGKKNEKRATNICGNALACATLLGVFLMVIVLLFLEPLMWGFGATPDSFGYAVEYTRIIAIGMPFLILGNAFCQFIRADGSPRYSMVCMLSGAILNCILDPTFIFVFNWGMAGAAWATIIGQFVSCLMGIIYMARGFKTVRLDKSDFVLKFDLIKAIVLLGMGAFTNQMAMFLVQITLNNALRYYGSASVYGSDIPLACAGIISKVNMIFMAFVIGITQGNQPIISFNYGAKNYKRVREAYKLGAIWAIGFSIIAFLSFQFFPRQIISLFGEGSEEYFTFAERYFRIYLFMAFANGLQPLTMNFLSSIGKAALGMFMALTRQVIFLLPLILIFPKFLGIDGIMYAGPVADLAAAIIAISLIRREFNIMRRLEKEDEELNVCTCED